LRRLSAADARSQGSTLTPPLADPTTTTTPSPVAGRGPDDLEPAPRAPTIRRLGETDTLDPPAEPQPGGEHVVQPGDHLWAIAEAELQRAWGRAPSDRQIDPYWRLLVAQNRDRLHDPANPDLLFPGDRISLPSAPAAATADRP
jgi:nucleoid-associated protein YgaU